MEGNGRLTLLLVGTSILLASLAQLMLKIGVSQPRVQAALAGGEASLFHRAAVIGTTPQVVLGLALFVASAMVWILVLSRIQLSTAYPFTAMGIVLTVLAGTLLLGEAMTPAKLAGLALIVAGLLVLGWATGAETR